MKNKLITTFAVVFLIAALPAFAGGPLNLNPNDPQGVERWPGAGANIPYNPDGVPAGGPAALALGSVDYTTAVAEINAGFGVWQAVPTATNTYSNNGPMPFDIDSTNFAPFIQNLFFGSNTSDGFSPIVLDQDGSIFLALFGPSGVLGFASPDTRAPNGDPIEAVCFLNGGQILAGFPFVDFRGVIVHEFGHYSGLAHTVTNGESVSFGDQSGPTPFDTYGPSPITEVETMYPFAAVGVSQFAVSLHPDDTGILSFLYPAAGFFANSATVSGTVFSPNGFTPLTGINVIARNVAAPFTDAVSAISGDRGVSGAYTFNGLTPNASYTVHIDQILAGGFSTPPLTLPGPEEFYNGAAESNNATSPDPPSDSVTVSAAAGATASGVDVIINGPAPGDPLLVGDDGFVELFMPFNICIAGQEFDSVFVNANGNLTFGVGSSDFTESSAELLGGPPRIAALWDDLSPFNLITGAQQGLVTFDHTADTFTVIFEDVPEFLNTGSNSFEITLRNNSEECNPITTPNGAGSDEVSISYGSLTAADGLAGIGSGEVANSGFEVETDLSNPPGALTLKQDAAVYELLSGFDNDLANRTLDFKRVGKPFKDKFEPNNSVGAAKLVALPFNTANTDNSFTELRPLAGDVDYFRIKDLEEGTSLVVEVLTGQIDSVLAIYDGNGNQLAVDDDGGTGFLSQLIFPVPADGDYFVAVSTWPDFDFDGVGGNTDLTFGVGRYVLDASVIDGILLDLDDDDFEEVALQFSFPFNGTNYNSVFVNSNGNLTFGNGDTEFSETVSEFLSQEPRIAPLWDDLSPDQGGLVIADSKAGSFSVSFIDVPEFMTFNANSFAVTLDSSGDIAIIYGNVAAVDGIAGVTPGGNIAGGPGAVDLSTAGSLSAGGSAYEQFSVGNPFDLANSSLLFVF